MSEQNGYNNQNFNEDYAYQTVMRNGRPKTRMWSVVSMIVGILSVVCCCFGWMGLFFGVAAIACAIISRNSLGYFDGMAIAGLVLGVFGTVFGLSFAVIPYLIPDELVTEYLEKLLEEYYGSLEGIE